MIICIQAEPEEFLNPNALSSDGTIALVRKSFSYNGSLLAYGLSESGSDWFTIHLKDVETGKQSFIIFEKGAFFSQPLWLLGHLDYIR